MVFGLRNHDIEVLSLAAKSSCEAPTSNLVQRSSIQVKLSEGRKVGAISLAHISYVLIYDLSFTN